MQFFVYFFFKQFWSEIPREFRKTQKYLQYSEKVCHKKIFLQKAFRFFDQFIL